MIVYRHPGRVAPAWDDRPLLTTPEGGVVVTDNELVHLWALANGLTLDEIAARAARFETLGPVVREAVACLAEAGLLERVGAAPRRAAAEAPDQGPLVSGITIVSSVAELDWLRGSAASVLAQRYTPFELIVVANGIDPEDVHTAVPDARVRVVTTASKVPITAALNVAASGARGDYLLFMNPDIVMLPGALARMVQRAEGTERVAAVSPKVLFLRTPGFINGIGNRVPPENWGTDNAIGHVDLGQFDGWVDIPSGSLYAMLVARRALDAVGGFDEGFWAYYEDPEWCHRARLAGWRVVAAPGAEVLHYFGGYWMASGRTEEIPARKLRRAVESRLRFAALIPGAPRAARMLASCGEEDAMNAANAVAAGQMDLAAAYLHGWLGFARSLRSVARLRRTIQARRVITDRELLPIEQTMPVSLTWRNSPLLTSELIARHYAPLIRGGGTRPLPEWPVEAGAGLRGPGSGAGG